MTNPRSGESCVRVRTCFRLALILMGTTAFAAQDGTVLRAPAFSANDLTTLPRGAWITNGGTLFNQRYSPLTALNRDNIGGLRALWRTGMGSATDPGHAGQAQILVYGDTLYVANGANDVFAIDVDSGRILWTYHGNPDPRGGSPIGRASRGVALGEGKVFVGHTDARLAALDQSTGKVIWSIPAERWQEGFAITAAPLYYEGLVIVGFNGGELGTRGRIKAYDARTGKLRWTFYTVPGPGELGHETWPQNSDAWMRGGASIWQTPAVDSDLGLIYFSTGNPGPDLNGSVRPGDNLFSVSIVAIEAKTGKYRWHFQQVHHDLWDYDSPNPVVLFDAMYGGRLRKGIVEIGKTGYVYILDRETGKPLVGIDEVPVPQEPRQATAATQPIPRGDEVVPHEIDIEPEGFTLINNGRIFTPFWDEPVVVKPLGTGGANWPPSSYDPESNLFYVCTGDGAAAYSTKEGGVEWVMPTPGGRYFGGEYTRSRVPRRGVLAAVDVRTNKLAWRQQWGELCYAGSTVTAGGLLFIGRNDGRLSALDKSNGAQLWEFQTDAGIHAAVSTFERNGKQYVVANSAGSFFPNTTRGDSIWLFALDGAGVPSGASGEPSGGPAELTH